MPNKVTPEELSKSEALGFVKKQYNAARKSSVLDFERFSRYYKLFRNIQTQKNYQGLANLFVPEPYRIVRKKTAKLANAIRSIKVRPEGPNDVENAKNNTQLMNFLRRKLNWFLTERTAIQESRIVGLSWIKALWDVDKEEESRPYKGFDLSFETSDKVLLDPSATILNIFEGELKWLVHQYEADIETLKKNKNYKEIDLLLLEKAGGTKSEETSLAQSRFANQARTKTGEQKSKKHTILEYWGKYTIDKKEKDYLIVIADNSIVLRFEENPYAEILKDNPIPFVPIIANPLGSELYPVGDLEPVESLFNELNDTRNQRMDTVTLNIDPMKVVTRGANISDKELIARRGWIVHSNLPASQAIQTVPPDMQGITASINEEKIIRSDIQQTAGSLDFTQGSDVQGGLSVDTARGAVIAKGEADVITVDDLEILKVCLRMLYRIVLSYAQFFLDREFKIGLIQKGKEVFSDIAPERIAGNFDLDIEMKTLQDATTDQSINLMLFNQAKTVPGAKIGKFFTDVLESIKGSEINVEEYYEVPPPPAPEPPKVSISLKGDLNSMQTSDIATQAGAKPESGDPLLNPDLRKLMGKLQRGEDVLVDDDESLKRLQVEEKTLDVQRAKAGGLQQKELSE